MKIKVEQMKVSLFDYTDVKLEDRVTKNVTLPTIFKFVKEANPETKQTIECIRINYEELIIKQKKLEIEESAEIRKEIEKDISDLKWAITRNKKSLSAFSPHVAFESGKGKGRRKEDILSISQVYHVDLDHADNKAAFKNMIPLLEKLKKDKTILAYFLSPSGAGIKIFFKLDISTLDKEEYFTLPALRTIYEDKLFKKFQSYFLKKYDLKIDQSTKDINRLCYVSYDPDIYVNKESTPVKLPKLTITELKSSKRKSEVQHCQQLSANGKDGLLEELYQFYSANGLDPTAEDEKHSSYDKWLFLSTSLIKRLKDEKMIKKYFHKFCSLYSKYDEKAVEEKINYQIKKYTERSRLAGNIKYFVTEAQKLGFKLPEIFEDETF